jgi:predicted DCC family thiol-disulfide oxidoreductase YuxK
MERATVLYDRDCGFCRWSLGKLLAWDRDGRLRPVALQDDEADRLLAGMSEEERMRSWHLVTADGKVHSAGAAFEPLFELLPGGGPPAALVRRLPRATERVYRWIADNRDRFGPRLTAGAKRRADSRIARRS